MSPAALVGQDDPSEKGVRVLQPASSFVGEQRSACWYSSKSQQSTEEGSC